ncbi:MAG TPA: alpha/beta hydrolase family protein [Chitinophagaceae bacterium]|nr:alpha/beta hydrolase family protein [Chitinophagaceae bacterium]
MQSAFCRFFALVFSLQAARAASVDTISIYSEAMHRSYKCVVIKPQAYSHGKKELFPVVYILHGYDGWYSNWLIRVPQLKDYADNLKMILVCPDGAKSSWYFDSPVDSSMRYETYIGKEVPEYIDSHYRSIKNRNGRAICGLSMGGHGALFLAFRHAETFGACASMSGVVNLASSHTKYDIVKRIGDTLTYADNWINYSIVNVVSHYPKDSLAIMIDCGVGDVFIAANRELHEKMLQLKIPHDYTERPGKHEWAYWRNWIQYQLLFFRNYFNTHLTP